ncbi:MULTISPECIES: Lrp/AsnC family transcriptional regulator [Arsenicicoccus]|uniref:Lrp/AsnC family transcriptional regulator n=1 Tax=Arsenicicoccus TaxID=267408 RepID=UPI00257F532B|nr:MULTISPECIES: Lrp/AsnC family transcriptional regulator [Arsenicicoccus]
MALDETDRRIVLALDEDPRMTVMLLAQRTGLARGTVQARLERLREDGVLRRHSSRVTPESLGYGVSAHVAAELDQHQIDAAIASLSRIPEVVECMAPAGETDLLVRVVATGPDDLYRVSELIRLSPGVIRTSTTIYLREVIPYRTDLLVAQGVAAQHRPRRGRATGRRPPTR